MTRPQHSSGLQTAAITMSVAAILLPLTIATLVEFAVKSTNPDGLDVSQGLAYLRPVLITAWTALAVCVGAAVVLKVLAARRNGSARRAWLVLAVQVVLGVAYLILRAAVPG